ncbi:MAG: hypothetical protein QM790_18295 [Nibricoccus sp.]
MRLSFVALFALMTASLSYAADISIVRVWPAYRPAESFERISEYFGKDEDPATHHVFRTQATQRAGYYFLVRLKNAAIPVTGARVELNIVTPFSTETRTFNFTCDLPKGSQAFHFGLTGSDWPGEPKDEAVAWQVRVLNAEGAELAAAQSYLWATPPQKK